MLDFLLGYFELTCKVLHAIVLLLIWAAYYSHKLTVWTSENNCWALVLMSKKFLIRQYLLASFILMDAPELDFTQQVPRHPVDPIKLTFISTVWTSVGILHEPMSFAVTAKRLFAILALNGILKDVVADSTDKLGQERFNMLRIINLFFFVYELLILF